jgi:four helix bundle protein
MNIPIAEIRSFRDLQVYRKAFQLQQSLFHSTRRWPREETYSLIDQIRRSSRSVGANVAEGWAKRRYPAHFLSKFTDADGELQETEHWLDTAIDCGYLNAIEGRVFLDGFCEVGKMLGSVMSKHEKFCLR